MFVGLRDGTLDSSFTFPSDLLAQPVSCSVGLSISGPFQTCPLHVAVLDVAEEFGK